MALSTGQLCIAGDWIQGAGAEFDAVNPSTGEVVWKGREADDQQVAAAVGAARLAQREWAARTFEDRAAVLRRFAEMLDGDAGQRLATLVSREAGKPEWEARTEVAACKGKVAASIQGADRNRESSTEANGAVVTTAFRPLGVIVVIGPFNFPLHMSNGHIVPALLAGNSVVLKPSPLVPESAEAYVRVMLEAGVPPGVLNLIQGGVGVAEAAIDEAVDGVCFTGSRSAGVSIHRRLAGRPEVLLTLEMGGNSPLVVWSYDNVDAAVLVTIQSAFATAGQRCNCARRLIVREDIADEFLDRLSEVAGHLVVGPPGSQPEPFMGPLITSVARDRFLAAQQTLLDRGATPILMARPTGSEGNFVTPALIDVTAIEVEDEEVFGPMLQVTRAASLEDAISAASNTSYGLAAGLVAVDQADFDAFRASVPAGLLSWNQQLTGASGLAPFGGIGNSGNHRPAGILSADYVVDGISVTRSPQMTVPASPPPGVVL